MVRIKYDRALLEELLKRDNSELLEDYSSVKINRDLSLKFKCNCGERYEKKFRYIKEQSGFFCKSCTVKIGSDKAKATFIYKYGVERPSQNEKIKDKVKDTNKKRYGFEYPLQNKEVKDKVKATNLQKYGVEYSFQNEEVKYKRKTNNLEKYGVEYTLQNEEVKSKIKATNLQKYGVEYPLQNKEVKDKVKATNLQKYGVEYPSQNPEIAERASKTAYKSKEYFLLSGRVIKVQGNEPLALDELLKEYNEDEIITSRKEVPKILWKDKEGKIHRYFSDIFIPKENRIIEVKSNWTFSQHDKGEKIEKVPVIATQAGYNYEYWIYDVKGNKEIKKFY
jgi:hypothetical protein